MDKKSPQPLSFSVPRDVALSGAGIALLMMGLAVIIAGGIVGVVLYRASVVQQQRRQLLDASGVTTMATVTRVWRETSSLHGDQSKTGHAAYVFGVDGREYGSESKMRSSQWQLLTNGSSLMVRYMPSDPNQNVVVGSEPLVMPLWAPVLIAGAMMALGALCITLLQIQRNLLANGRVASGVVTGIVKRHTSHGGTHRSIKYDFQLLSGATASGKSSTTRNIPPVGSVISVIYDPDRPKLSAPYPMGLVRVRRVS